MLGVVLRTFDTRDPKCDPESSILTHFTESLPLQALPKSSAIRRLLVGGAFLMALSSLFLFLLRAANILAASPSPEGFETIGLIRALAGDLEPFRGRRGLKLEDWF